MSKLLKILFKISFYASIKDNLIDEEFILEVSRIHLNTKLGTWKNVYLLSKYEYCFYRFKEVYGPKRFNEFAARAWEELNRIEVNSKRRIEEQMEIFPKNL